MIDFKGKEMICFDLETTGSDTSKDKTVQIFVLKISPEGKIDQREYIVNPEIPIHPKATEVHGFTNEFVADKPTFKQIAVQLYTYIQDAGTIVTYNGNRFDIPILMREFTSVGIDWNPRMAKMIDVFNLVLRMNPRNLTAMLKHYTGEDLEDAHDAGSDVWATIKILYAMYKAHPEIPSDPADIELFANNDKPMLDINGFFTTDDDGDPCFSTGKYAGEKVNAKIHAGYLDWMVTKGNFAKDTTQLARKFLNNQISN